MWGRSMVGDQVLFKGIEYVIVYKYSNDYCEIQEKRNKFHFELVPLSDLQKLPNPIKDIKDPVS
jgi:hypothetical protein